MILQIEENLKNIWRAIVQHIRNNIYQWNICYASAGLSRHLHICLTMTLCSSKAQGCKYFWKPFKPCHIGIHRKALAEYTQMSTHMPGFQSIYRFYSVKLATSCIRVNYTSDINLLKRFYLQLHPPHALNIPLCQNKVKNKFIFFKSREKL